MKTKFYKCTFKSDIILRGSSNTEGSTLNLDFIPGNNFLGMVAKNYAKFKNPFDVFHSGKVKFCDGEILINSKLSYKIPLSFHKKKLGEDKYNKIHFELDDLQSLIDLGIQLKQIRSGYMNDDFQFVNLDFNYHQKSSRESEKRRSKDGGMFGYTSLKKGSEWAFKIIYEDESYIEEVQKYLLGNQLLGKAKTSQFGTVFIEELDKIDEIKSFNPDSNLTYIYAKSRISLFDERGNTIALRSARDLGIKGEIIWEKTYIKTGEYLPYNYKKNSHEMMRVFIEKGSVIAVKDCEIQTNFIGKFQNEGFGEIIINPSFLREKKPSLEEFVKKSENNSNSKEKISDYSDNLTIFLNTKDSYEKAMFNVANIVTENYESLMGPSRSQWGVIRSFVATSKDKDEFIEKIKDFTSSGVAKNQWSGKSEKLISLLEQSPHYKELAKLLAMIVSKYTKKGSGK